MKTIAKQLLSVVLLMLSGSIFMSVAQADGDFTTGEIVKIDNKKKIIYFHDDKYYFDSKTLITDRAGTKYKASDLRPGLTASVGIDPKRRYISFPTLKSLLLLSAVDE